MINLALTVCVHSCLNHDHVCLVTWLISSTFIHLLFPLFCALTQLMELFSAEEIVRYKLLSKQKSLTCIFIVTVYQNHFFVWPGS